MYIINIILYNQIMNNDSLSILAPVIQSLPVDSMKIHMQLLSLLGFVVGSLYLLLGALGGGGGLLCQTVQELCAQRIVSLTTAVKSNRKI